ncbi:MAG: VIT domain-containing protein [Planctomycetota bacterium]
MTSTTTLPASDDLGGTRQECGLGGLLALAHGSEQPFPLRLVRVRTDIAGNVARSTVEQRFVNPFDAPVEAVHIFPLPGDGALIDVRLTAGDVTVRAECRERAAAERELGEARERGQRAALVTQERADVHTLRVTNIPPRAEVSVHLVVVEKLDAVDGRHQWRFPTTIAPRYTPGEPIDHSGPGVVPDTDRVPDASRLQPPIRLQGGTRLDLEVAVRGPVRSLRCSQHACQMQQDDGGVRIAPAAAATLDRDFVLELGYADAKEPAARAWTDGEYTLLAIEPPEQGPGQSVARDAVFVIDISGSMQGAKLDAAKRAVTAALHGLTAPDRFALLAFDDHVESFAPGFSAYDEASLARADRWIGKLGARGGTELCAAITQAFAGEQPADRLRTVLLITDGQVTNEAELLRAVHERRGRGLLFVVGIDTAVHGSLLKRLARVGGGACDLCVPTDDVEAVIARVESRFGTPVMEGVRVAGAPGTLPLSVFAGRAASLLLEGAGPELAVEAHGASGTWRARAVAERIDFALGALWARDQIQALEDELAWQPAQSDALRATITQIALAHGIASRFTAFVAVERRLTVDGKPVEIVQPVELPASWDESFHVGTILAATSPASAPPQYACRVVSPPPASPSGAWLQKALGALAGARAGADPAPAIPSPARSEPAAELARTQSADGSRWRRRAHRGRAARARAARPHPHARPAQAHRAEGGYLARCASAGPARAARARHARAPRARRRRGAVGDVARHRAPVQGRTAAGLAAVMVSELACWKRTASSARELERDPARTCRRAQRLGLFLRVWRPCSGEATRPTQEFEIANN